MRTAELDARRQTHQKQQSAYGQKQLASQFWEESYAASGSAQNRQAQSYNKNSTFGKEIQNKTNHAPVNQYNFGEYGTKKTSVKVHHAPGGRSDLNVFGGDDQPRARTSAGGRRKAQSNAPVTEKEAYQVQWTSQTDQQYDQNCYNGQVNKIR